MEDYSPQKEAKDLLGQMHRWTHLEDKKFAQAVKSLKIHIYKTHVLDYRDNKTV